MLLLKQEICTCKNQGWQNHKGTIKVQKGLILPKVQGTRKRIPTDMKHKIIPTLSIIVFYILTKKNVITQYKIKNVIPNTQIQSFSDSLQLYSNL